MSNVHITTMGANKLRLVCHVPIPAGSNAASVTWQTALVNAKLATVSVLTPAVGGGNGTIDSTPSTGEVDQLAAGSLYERVLEYDLGSDWSGLSGANKAARIDAVFAQVKSDVQAELQSRLNFFGFTR